MPAEEKPFAFIMQRIKFLEQDGICPISALQADYQELPQPMQDKLQQLSQMEIDVFVELLKEAKQQGAPKLLMIWRLSLYYLFRVRKGHYNINVL